MCAMSANQDSQLLRWVPALILMALIFIFSGTPAGKIPSFGEWDTLIKKGGHALGFGMLGLAYSYALPPRLARGSRWLLSLLMVFLFALSDEFHQSFVQGRNSSFLDVVIDTGGALVALTMAFMTIYSSNSRSKSIS
jgi:VanZ family protein